MPDDKPSDLQAKRRPSLHRRIGRIVALCDRFGIDGLINAFGVLVFAAAESLRPLQNGKVQVSVLIAMAVLVAILVAVMLGLPALFLGAVLLETLPC
jgi:hypothetical protein